MDDAGWAAVGKLIDLVKLLVIIALLGAVGYGLLKLDAVLAFSKEAIELLKAAR